MPEYDAFGREIPEDGPHPIALEAQAHAAGDVAGEAFRDDVRDTARAVAGEAARTIRLGLWAVRLVVVAGVLIGGGFAVSAGIDAVEDSVERVRGAIDDVGTAVAGGGEEQDAGSAGAPRPPSLLRPRRMARALRVLEADAPGRLRSLRVEAARIDVQQHLRGGRIRSVQLHAGGEAADVLSTTPGGFPDAGTFAYGDVRPGAAARLVRAANRRTGRRTADVGHLVLTRTGDDLTWGVYYRGGAIVQGDERGRVIRRIG